MKITKIVNCSVPYYDNRTQEEIERSIREYLFKRLVADANCPTPRMRKQVRKLIRHILEKNQEEKMKKENTKIVYATIRETDEDYGIEVRLSNGQKWTMITIDNRLPDAEKIADTINALINGWHKQEPGLVDDKLREMMRDPRYWRDRDPDYVRLIENGFKKLYGGN